ncbi:hypothetical protein [Desulfovibrio sp. ZJ369]|uniref:hypothetical protein n=1 Tax=Desulfovibrio sp. ZJ369 TaxID=2709793 RepID=UPI0013E9F754|nr:hypothetical protein [Desulfovibrio sp. ZJ369]
MSSAPTEESALRGQEYNTLLCERFDPAQTLVGFYISVTNASQDEWMNPLALELRRRGYAVVGLLAREAVGAARLDGTELTLELARGSVAALSRVQLFIVSDLEGGTDFPPRSRVLACAHGCVWCCGSTNFVSVVSHQAYFDGYLTSCPLTQSTREQVQALWTGFVPPSACKRPSPHFYILASGYPRSAVLYHKLAELEGRVERDAILYAPISVDHHPSAGGCLLERYGKRIVRCLLDSFPHLRLIFRPYRTDLEHPQVQALLAAFAHEPRFELDTDPQRAPAFSRAAVLVTDFSHIANSFAFTTLRPAVRFQPWEYVRNRRTLDTLPTGFCARTYQALIRAVREGLESPGPCREHIRQQREQGMLPVESGLQDLAEQLDDFLRDRPRPEWISIERNNPSLTLGEAGIVKTMLSLPRYWETIASVALRFFPESLFLTAFSLHMGLRLIPDQAVPARLLASARRLLQEPPPIGDDPLLFRDVSPEIPRKLYGLAQLKAFREHDLDLAGMAENLKTLL